MNATVLRFREPFYAVTPGTGAGPGEDGPEPVPYAHTPRGLISALEHAKFLSRGGGTQDVILTRGNRAVRVLARFTNGTVVRGNLLPAAYPENWRPAPGEIRPGSPGGHIPEVCTHAKNRTAGTRPRRNRNMPKPYWPGIDITVRKAP